MPNGSIRHDWASDLEPIMPFATERQKQYAHALVEYGSIIKAAEALGVNRTSITKSLASWRRNAEKKMQNQFGDIDANDMVPESHYLKGVSTLSKVNQDTGELEPSIVWTKTDTDKDKRIEKLMQDFDDFAQNFSGLSKVFKPPTNCASDLINVIPYGDPHAGMYAWAEEAGADWDSKKFESMIVGATSYLLKKAPKADTLFLISLGDLTHSADASELTQSGHKLDVDSRFPNVVKVAMRGFRNCIEMGLKRHKKVVVVLQQGNHCRETSVLIQMILEAFYSNNDRVEFLDNLKLYNYLQFGKNLFGVHHGDKQSKPENLEAIMVNDCSDIWSETAHRKWFCGHFHSTRVHDMRNCLIEFYRVLQPQDAWAFQAGYRSSRDLRLETYHREIGYIGMNLFNPLTMMVE